jgi:hypothetical protein
MNEDICPADEPREFLWLLTRVENDSTLVRIKIQKEPAFFRVDNSTRKGAALPRQVASRLLDFDHLSAKVSHELGGICGRDHITEFEHFHALKTLHGKTSFTIGQPGNFSA